MNICRELFPRQTSRWIERIVNIDMQKQARKRKNKAALWADSWRTIGRTWPRFLALVAIIALGVGFFVGIRAAEPNMVISMSDYARQQNYQDIQVLSTYGLRARDLAILDNIDGIKYLPYRYVDRQDDDNYIYRIFQNFNEIGDINQAVLVEGRWPKAKNEVVIDSLMHKKRADKFYIGAQIELNDTGVTDNEKAPAITENKFTIVGFADLPMYIDATNRGQSALGKGMVDAFLLASPEIFTGEYYTAAAVNVDAARQLTAYSDEYDDVVEAKRDQIEKALAVRKEEVFIETKTEAQQKIADSRQELATAKDKLADGKRKIADGESELSKAKTELKEKTADSQQEIETGAELIQAGTHELAAKAGTLAEAEVSLNNAQQKLAAAKAEINANEKKLAEADKALAAGADQLTAAQKLWNEKNKEFQAGKSAYEQNLAKYEAGLKALNESKAKLADSKKQLESAKKQYEEGLQQLEAALKEFPEFAGKLTDKEAEQIVQFNKFYALIKSQYDKYISETYEPAAAEIQAERTELANEKQNLATKQAELDKEKADYEDKIAVLSAAIDKLEAAEEAGELSPEAESKLQDLRAELAKTKQEYQDFLAGTYQPETAEINSGNEEIKQQEIALNTKAEALEAEKQKSDASIAKLDEYRAQIPQELWNLTEEDLPKIAAVNQKYAEVSSLYAQTQKEYEDFLTNIYEPNMQKIKAGEQEIASNEKTLTAAKVELNQAKNQLTTGQKQLEAGKAEIEKNAAKLAANKSKLAAARTKLEQAQKLLKENEATLAAKNSEYQQGLSLLAAAQEELNAKTAELEQARQDLADGVAAAEAKISDSEDELQTAKQKITDNEVKIKDGESELVDAEKQLQGLRKPNYIIANRDFYYGYNEYKDNAKRIGAVAKVFPVIFFLIAALVSYTVMTRMVEEERINIGTYKALGYDARDISLKFFLYAVLALLIGLAIGVPVGNIIFPTLIVRDCYGMLYNVPYCGLIYHWKDIISCTLVSTITTIGPAILTTRKTLEEVPAELMRPKQPKGGSNIWLEKWKAFWSKLSFNMKVTFRNLDRFKGRNSMTVIGVAGCTMLLLTGFAVRNSIMGVADRQFDNIQMLDAVVKYKDDISDQELKDIADNYYKNKNISAYMNYYSESSKTTSADINQQTVNICVLPKSSKNFGQFYNFYNLDTGEAITEMPDDGVLITQKLASMLNKSAGDIIEVEDDAGDKLKFKIYAVTENYLAHYLYMDEAAYENFTGQSVPQINSAMLKFSSQDQQLRDDLVAKLNDDTDITGVSFVKVLRDAFDNAVTTLILVVIVLVVAAAILDFIVLYSLINVSVSERIRELSTLKVLGSKDYEITLYVYREVIILVALGIILGLFLGPALSAYVLRTVEIDIMVFPLRIKPISYVIAILLALVFSAIVMLIMNQKIKEINMVEALKGVE